MEQVLLRIKNMRFAILIFSFVFFSNTFVFANLFELEAVRLEKASDKLKKLITTQKNSAKLKQDLLVLNNNIKRWREFSLLNDSQFVLVDIAGFQVFFYQDGKQLFQTRALVGQKNTPTPIFRTEIKEIVLNPWWVIPQSIVFSDILPLLEKNVKLLEEEEVEVFKPAGKRLKKIFLTDSERKRLHTDPTRYLFKQRPGKLNPMGTIKFISTDINSIYLHATPEPELFQANNRAVSHGCVRIEDQNSFALLLLKQTQTEFSPEKFSQLLQIKNETKIVLKQKIPVYFGYWTAWADKNLDYHLREDIYNLDEGGIGLALATPD